MRASGIDEQVTITIGPPDPAARQPPDDGLTAIA